MGKYHSMGFRLEIMVTPTRAEVELYDADLPFDPPIAEATGTTPDEAVAALLEIVTFNNFASDQED